ncbi:MAG: response regulator transcription factor [Candidatus Dormiibacterota bacterium]|jgi:DNA-binding NarL/FixJ family response regulator
MIRLLIIDDHEMVREGLKAILTADPDFTVVGESSSAHQIVELVERTHPDVVLLDARLPGVSGPEACRRLTDAHPEVPVLVVSTYSDDELVDACIAAGAKGYVIKDIERFTLKQSIRAVHSGQGAASPAIAARVFEWLRDGREVSSSRPPLSERQLTVVRLASRGYSNREIAAQMSLTENTVKSHLQDIFRRLDVRNRVEAVMRATQEGWI